MTSRGLLSSFAFAFLVAGISGPSLSAVPSLNLASTFDPIKAKAAAGQQVSIVTLGDSITENLTGWQPVFTSLMQSAYGNAGRGYQALLSEGGSDWIDGAGDGTNDPSPHQAINGYWTTNPGTPATTSSHRFITPYATEVKQQFLAQPGGGTVQARVYAYGGALISTYDINTASATKGVQTWSYSGPETSEITYTAKGDGPVTLYGYTAPTTGGGVVVHQAAHGGWGIDNYLHRDGTFDQQLKSLTPDLITLWVGQNDGYTQPDFSDYRDRMQAEIDRIKADEPDAKILLVGSYDTGAAKLPGLNGAIADVAEANGLGFINLYETLGSFDYLTQQGILGDGVHLSQEGGQFVGNYLFNAYQTDTAANVPEPTSGLLLAVAGSALLRRRRR